MRKTSIILAAIAFAGTTSACKGAEPSADFQASLPAPPPARPAGDGSIFQVGMGYAPLYVGNRARAVGDPVTILLVESTSTSKSAGSKTDREGGFSLTPPTTGPFSLFNPSDASASGSSAFKGQGTATQSSALSGQLSVTIAEVRSNGTALVRGQKLLELSQGKEWVQFSGILRLSDIDEDSRILSTRVADARIVYTGKGSIQRASREGWLSRFFNMISPF